MTMVEQVARALATANGDDFDSIPKDKRDWTDRLGRFGEKFRDIALPMQSDYLDMARAAVKAMLTPTETMQIAGLCAGYDAAKPGLQRMEEAERAKGTDGWLAATVAVGAGAIYDAAYTAMIGAALEEQP